MFLICDKGYSQINYSTKVETGFLKYQYETVQVSPGSYWKGHKLYKKTGVDLNIINGLGFRNKFLVGIGFGYLNFEDINRLSVFSDFEYLPLKPDYHR